MFPTALSLGLWAAFFCATVVRGAPAGDRILALPGWDGDLPTPQYSGYLDLPGGNKHIHYWFITSTTGADANTPTTVWLNGGPGCSSLDGLVYEHGPFRFDEADPSKLVLFNYSWNRAGSHMLYLEAPVGVGFSYSDDPADYNCTDDTTAQDNLHAVEAFFTSKFPELSGNALYLTGESYVCVCVCVCVRAWCYFCASFLGASRSTSAVLEGSHIPHTSNDAPLLDVFPLLLPRVLCVYSRRGGDTLILLPNIRCSYAGVYVPTLAEAIVHAVEAGTYKGAPLKGIAVGNGCSGSEVGVCGGARSKYDAQFFAQSTAMLGPGLQAKLNAECDWTKPQDIEKGCQDAIAEMGPLLDRINLYNVYGECIIGTGMRTHRDGDDADEEPQQERAQPVRHKAPVSHLKASSGVAGPDACIDSIEASDYINQKALIKAIHVKPIDYRWATCGSVPGWHYTSTRPNLPRDTYPLLVQHMRVVVYNGDWDACVPWTDNYAWTEHFASENEFPVVDAWHPWTFSNLDDFGEQVGGYAVNYKGNFTFITVRGGRHEVPETAPKRAFEMFSRLIRGESF